MRSQLTLQALTLTGATYIVQLVYVLVGRSAFDRLMMLVYNSGFHPMEQNQRELLWKHPLIIAVLGGLVLGVIPFHALASGFGFLTGPSGPWKQRWQRAKAWIAVPFALAFLQSISSYVANERSGAPPAWQSFFAAPCSLDAAHVLTYRNGCANQVLFTAPFICALVYSLTALLDRRRNSAHRESLLAVSGPGEIV
jgi:hypothetical protein